MTRQRRIYVDDPADIVLLPGYLEELRDLGIDYIVLCVHDPQRGWTWTAAQARRGQDRCESLGLGVSLMTWAPVGRPLDAHARRLSLARPRRWEPDVEGQVVGKTATQRLIFAQHLRELADEYDVPLDLNSHAGHSELVEGGPDVHDLLGSDEELWGQAYCLAERSKTEPLLGLPRAVERTIARMQRIKGPFRRGIILAAWDQSGFPQGPFEAMREAYQAARGYTDMIGWWSSKFASSWGVKKNSYSAGAIRGLLSAG
jgi:hypothetical protein